MTTIKTNNFNFQGIGFPIKSSGLIPPPPPPPPIVYVPPAVFIVTDTVDINGSPGNSILRVLFDKAPCLTNPPTYFEGVVQVPVQDPGTGNLVFFDTDWPQTDFLSQFVGNLDVTQIFGPNGLTYAEAEVTAEFDFHWEDTNGNIVHTESVEEDLTLVFGCTDNVYAEYNVNANVNDGTCSTYVGTN